MGSIQRMGAAMAWLLIGLGIAVIAKVLVSVGVERLVLGHVVGPGLVLAGVARLRLQRALEERGGPTGGDDGRAS